MTSERSLLLFSLATSIYIPQFRIFAFCCSLALEAGIRFAFIRLGRSV